MSEVRRLRPADIPQAMQLKEAAGWNQTEEDWRRVLELEPEGCFGIEREGRLVATTTAICYGRELAWIGMVLTDPGFRGQGLASQLMRRALEFLDGRRVECVKLDATDMGRSLYQKFGFVDECPSERWVRAAAPAAPVALGSYECDAAMDLRAFGADRRDLLARLAAGESASIPGSGYAMGRPGSKAAFFGPCIATSLEAARSFAEWFIARHAAEPVYWDLLPDNPEAMSLAGQLGFERVRQLTRMARGETRTLQQDIRQVYAIAGFEFG
jgi:GNAT superfamily N-acetyltransferase